MTPFRSIVLIACVCLVGLAAAQESGDPVSRSVEVLVPEVLSVRSETSAIEFDLSQVDYPPREFPRRYPSTSLPDGVLPIDVLATAEGAWELQIQIEDLVDPVHGAIIPSQRILYSVDGGTWIRADGTPQVIVTGTRPTDGWRRVEIGFVLEVQGDERAGAYEVTSLLSGLYSD